MLLIGLRRRRGWGEIAAYCYFFLRPHLFRDLQRGRRESASTGCLYWELREIHRSVMERSPCGLVEFGAGLSTVVICDALERLHRNGHVAQFTAFEEADDYLRNLRAWFPERLVGFVSLRLSSVSDTQPDSSGHVARTYTSSVEYEIDWAFVDGPQLPEDANYFDGDVLKCTLAPTALVIIDGRQSTVRALGMRLHATSVVQNKDPEFAALELDSAQ